MTETTRRNAPRLLRDIRWAYRNVNNDKPGRPQAMNFRQLYREDQKAFLAIMSKHEQIQSQALNQMRRIAGKPKMEPTPRAADPLPEDEGSRRALEVLKRMEEEP